MTTHTATYSPEDNKLRLYPAARLDAATYERVRAAGFAWAAKQGLFVAGAWTPERADLLTELCGEIGDEDSSLMDRAEERAERFDGYRESWTADAEAAQAAAERIMDGIPLGQPILVGHHSERHARRDAERIESGIRRAVRAWETAGYWKGRAAAAIRHAKYKERPDVRARRIKGLEADERKQAKTAKASRLMLSCWENPIEKLRRKDGQPGDFRGRVLYLANIDGACWGLWGKLDRGDLAPEAAQAEAIAGHRRIIERAERWLAHISGRLEYERAMLAEAGGTIAQRTGPEKGGAVRCWASPRGGWSYVQKVNRVSVSVLDNWGNGGRNFARTIAFDKLQGVMTAAEVRAAREAGRIIEDADGLGFFLRPETPPEPPAPKPDEAQAGPSALDAMRATLRSGVQVVAAPQLFPTPDAIARRMVGLAGVSYGVRVLEPSAGTGALVGPLLARGAEVVAVEVNGALCESLRGRMPAARVHCADFLETNGEQLGGPFDRVVMNPPFGDGADVRHIQHARALLRPGGRLVALCAGGPRQEAALRPLASSWEPLPEGSFRAQGTDVRVVLLTMDRSTIAP